MKRSSYNKKNIGPNNFQITQKTTGFLGFMTNPIQSDFTAASSETIRDRSFLKSKKHKQVRKTRQKAMIGRQTFNQTHTLKENCCVLLYEHLSIIIDKFSMNIDSSAVGTDGFWKDLWGLWKLQFFSDSTLRSKMFYR